VTEDHEAIEELLAGYALRSLEEDDAREAERILADHVPGCLQCRETLAAFQEVLGELGLSARPVEPPDLLLARLRAEIAGVEETARPSVRHRRPFASLVAAAAAIAMLGLVGWNAVLNQRLGHVQSQQQKVAGAVSFLNAPGSKVVGLRDAQLTSSQVLMGYRPQETRVVLFGTEVPEPSAGHVYRLWLGQDGDYNWVGNFVPDEGIVVLTLRFDASRYDQILITEEPSGETPIAPHGSHRWSATLAPAA
jgi:hypothetical protein